MPVIEVTNVTKVFKTFDQNEGESDVFVNAFACVINERAGAG